MEFVKWFLEAGPRILWKILFVCVVFMVLQQFGIVSLSSEWVKFIVPGAVVSLSCLCIDIITSIARFVGEQISGLVNGWNAAKEMKETLYSLPGDLRFQLLSWAIQDSRTISLPMNQTRAADMLCAQGVMEYLGSPRAVTLAYRIKMQPWKYLQQVIKNMNPHELAQIAKASEQHESMKRVMPWASW